MSLTDINQDIDICLLKYIIGSQDFDIDEVSKKIYEGLIENNKCLESTTNMFSLLLFFLPKEFTQVQQTFKWFCIQ